MLSGVSTMFETMKSTGIDFDQKVMVFIDWYANLTAVYTHKRRKRLRPRVMQLSDAYECVAQCEYSLASGLIKK